MSQLVYYLLQSISAVYSTQSMAAMPILVVIAYMVYYYNKRYRSPLATAPLAPAEHFLVKHFGLVPPPSDAEKVDTLSQFLIRVGQDASLSPISVCWSITGTPLVIVNTLKGIKDVLIDGQAKSKVKDEPSKVQRGNLIRLIQNLVFGGKSLNNVVGEEWRWRRHILLPPFQPKQLVPKLLPYVASRAATLLKVFEEHSETGEAIELDDLFMDMTMDVINYYLYGRSDLNYEIVGGRRNLKNEHHRLGLGFMSVEAWLPFGINKTNWAQRTYKPARDVLKKFIRDSLVYALEDYKRDVKEYEEQDIPVKQRSYRSVAACAFASGRYADDQVDLINDLLSLTFAGYDTTAHTLAFAFSELARNPALQDELFAQVRQMLGPPPVAPESVTAEKLARMPLVTAIYRETLRKYPAVVFIPVHVNRDTVVDGAIVPGGAEIWCNVRGVQMNPAVFPDPDKFDPTRWLRPEDKMTDGTLDNAFDNLTTASNSHVTITPETQYNFPDLSFTLGQHACIGKNLAILELRTVIACTMNQFYCTLKKDSVIDTKIVLTTKPRHGVWVHFKKR
ncbi:cytochrome P450 [Mucor ambiguus]|uniref:Cytochrome P450 n=1 Tax=Mucor ambiguus TaxID=91626 RepID=A0A0C9M9L5_9FUNG|nr:cytochrome P450 [Mucor ambiguus]